MLTYKFSQDHIELFFCSLRSRFGSNNNPTAKQFQQAYKRLLLHQEIRGNRGNCIVDDDSFLLPITSQRSKKVNGLDNADLKQKQNDFGLLPFETDHNYTLLSQWPSLSEFQSAVIEYISVYCVKMAVKSIKCHECIKAVTEETNQKNYKLVNRKDRGGLIHVNASVRAVCEITEKTVKKILLVTPANVPTLKDIKFVVTASVLQNVLTHHE